MAVDCFLKLGDIKGESKDHQYADWIEVLSWSWGMSQLGTMHSGTGGGTGKVNVQDFSVTKFVDKSTPNIIQKCCTGKHYPEATFIARKAGDKPVDYVKLTMKEVIVTSAGTGGGTGEDRVTESVTLNFAHFKYEYTPQSATGAKEPAITQTFDIRANTE
ncbi:Hcp family type VI secretion system effector [Halochromatium glycolicum]|jgi:type VI secretion system secreted protein Hcp|uniref:Hcp1 family type VI secretion system effector n=1 Tax=Halochromatium glycolicum TaxID=85075 RepID=A0AAJ0U5B8_9GAMM|nr:type VI secretion system tube protein Hcp [Halochromatium glycolicum]MBK1705555.1 Hcp1 family type VI secretion system effector [Halochromatium glycolicum]